MLGRPPQQEVTLTNSTLYITSKAVRAKCGNVSDMTLWRWEQNAAMAFPRAAYINNRKYYVESEIDAWLAARTKVAPAVDHLRKGAA